MTRQFREVDDVLGSYPTETAHHRRLHAIPPHEVHEIEFGGERAVCKLARGPLADPELEARVLQFIEDRARVPVPAVLAVGDDHFVARWHDGLPEDPTLDDARIRAMGAGLAQLHADAADHFEATGHLRVDGDRLPSDADDRWSDTLCILLDDRREYLADRGYAHVADEALRFVREHREAFDAVGDATLLHGNFLPEHVGIDRDRHEPSLACVIDAEHALVGPAEWDLLRTGGPTFGPLHADRDEEGWSAFLDAYESVRPLPPDLDDRLRLLAPINGVSYLRALHPQRSGRDDLNEIARRARGLAEFVLNSLAELDEERS